MAFSRSTNSASVRNVNTLLNVLLGHVVKLRIFQHGDGMDISGVCFDFLWFS
ncbi:hypothetical protein [Prosthecochloris sp. CIB 2401]|uniref:hypothetical protein n=1 Tax=Prosthecochloris sp. CIB 2401 TaxID=1868325 RepID=UPI00080ABB1D|nr:hypothetical protein [Prosthecochloris sp. CIB 2401]ANT65132.1 hypothetical protein Ptc2401_01366 [Prosthecochloris sp. CIB 2401]